MSIKCSDKWRLTLQMAVNLKKNKIQSKWSREAWQTLENKTKILYLKLQTVRKHLEALLLLQFIWPYSNKCVELMQL